MAYLQRVFIIVAMLFIGFAPTVVAQQKRSADKIVAVVGRNRIVLQSELDAEAQRARINDSDNWNDTMKCVILQQIVMQKMLVEQAERDSVLVTDEEVEGTLENRIRYFISQYGSKERLEALSGKTVYQIKDDNRDVVKESLIAEKMKAKVLEHVKITPQEVQQFYKAIPVDSLPFFPATVEVGEIVIDPPVSTEMDQYAHNKLEDIRKDIVDNKKSFEALAGLYSQDPGSRDNGGDLGLVSRSDLVPEFAAAAFKLQPGEISPIVKSKYGYHIIQMIDRKGDQVHVRHILISGERTSGDFKKSLTKLDSVRSMLITRQITFPEAVGKYSNDENSKMTGGMITDRNTGASSLEINKLDADLALMIDSLKPGDYSQPQIFTTPEKIKSTRIVYLKTRTEPHKANMKDDYSKLQSVALNRKQYEKLQQWLQHQLPTYYYKIDPEYMSCTGFAQWKTASVRKGE